MMIESIDTIVTRPAMRCSWWSVQATSF